MGADGAGDVRGVEDEAETRDHWREETEMRTELASAALSTQVTSEEGRCRLDSAAGR